MEKLALRIEELSVESFDVASAGQDGGGTVEAFNHTRGNHATCDPAVGTCFGYTCYATCQLTCPETCFASCDGGATCVGETCWGTCVDPVQ